MLKVNNKKTLSLLAKRAFKTNKMRNVFAMIAIILTTVLFTSLFTIVSSLVASIEESTMWQVGGNAHGSFKYLSLEEYNTLKTHPSIKEISYSVILGVAENKELYKRPTELRYANDEIIAKSMFSMPTTGRLPINDDEFATDTLVLKQLGVPAKLGEKATFVYSVGGQQKIATFTLVGFWEGDKLMQASMLWLNRSYVEKELKECSTESGSCITGTINADVKFSNSFAIEKKLQTVIIDSGYTLDDIDCGVNWAYSGNSGSLDIGSVVAAIGCILMIVFCGYLMISNVFTISIVSDVRYYGLIKTIGTTPKQIRQIVHKQALWVCVLGVPVGIAAGYVVGVLLVPVVLSIINTDVIKMSANPIIFILSALFSVLTVVISVSKPSKIAAKISPIEALRVTDNSGDKRAFKKSIKVNLPSMALNNMMRNKKKAVLVTISLSLGLVILNATYSAANSFDMDKYLSLMIGSDFAVGDVSNFNVNLNYTNQDTLDETFFEQLSQQDGIENINKIYFSETLMPANSNFSKVPLQDASEYGSSNARVNALTEYAQQLSFPLHVYGLDDGALDKLTILKGSLDKKKLSSGDFVIASPHDDAGKILYYNIGDTVSLPDINGKIREYTVIAIANIPYSISVKHSHPLTPAIFLPSQVFLKQIEQKAPMLTTIDVGDNYIERIEKFLEEYSNEINQDMDFDSKASLAAEYENTQRTFKTVGVTLSALVALVGIMNFINTVITSIISRKREVAMLQSIGMTNRQVVGMLGLESLMYILLALITTLTIGSALFYLGLSFFVSHAAYMTLYFTVLPSLCCLPAMLLIALVVPVLSQRRVCKLSVVERLREAE